jgi:hypothetical protein
MLRVRHNHPTQVALAEGGGGAYVLYKNALVVALLRHRPSLFGGEPPLQFVTHMVDSVPPSIYVLLLSRTSIIMYKTLMDFLSRPWIPFSFVIHFHF